jgi:hypothetical protein
MEKENRLKLKRLLGIIANILIMLNNVWIVFVLFLFYILSDMPPISPMAAIFKNKLFLIIPTLLIAYMVYKEIKFKTLAKRFYTNLIISACIIGFWAFVTSLSFGVWGTNLLSQ